MEDKPIENFGPNEFVEGIHFYFEGGVIVMTERYLIERGYCCGNGCRHCPYPKDSDQSRYSSSSL
jgi:hypothetical protein